MSGTEEIKYSGLTKTSTQSERQQFHQYQPVTREEGLRSDKVLSSGKHSWNSGKIYVLRWGRQRENTSLPFFRKIMDNGWPFKYGTVLSPDQLLSKLRKGRIFKEYEHGTLETCSNKKKIHNTKLEIKRLNISELRWPGSRKSIVDD